MEYSDTVIEHFMNPRNVGVLEDADGIGHEGSPTCGDSMDLYIKVSAANGVERISDVSFQTFGCAAAVASSSMFTEMVKGMTLAEAVQMNEDDIVEALGGLPPLKIHCSLLATGALADAIRDYHEKSDEQAVD